MDTDGIDRLAILEGEEPTDAHLRTLESAIARQNRLPGRDVRMRRYPWGSIVNYDGQGCGGSISPLFEPSVSRTGEDFQISWQRGLINGVEPTINEIPISQPDPDTNKPPFLTVTTADFGPWGEALVYLRVHLDQGWNVESIEPVAAPTTPPLAAWAADKLSLILFPDGTYWRALHMNAGLISINRRDTGFAQHLFFARP